MTESCPSESPFLLKNGSHLSISAKRAICVAYKNGTKVRLIAERFGVSRQRVCQIAEKAGLPKRRRGFNAGRKKKTEQELYEGRRRRELPCQLERARRRHLHLVREAKRLGLWVLLDEQEKGYE